jgi:O-phosphoseryl-tRNA(Cys) synthetase
VTPETILLDRCVSEAPRLQKDCGVGDIRVTKVSVFVKDIGQRSVEKVELVYNVFGYKNVGA